MEACLDLGKIVERGDVGSDDDPTGGTSGRGDDEIVRSPRFALMPTEAEEIGMYDSHVHVVLEHRDRDQHVVDEGLSRLSPLAVGEQDSNLHLGHGDRSDRYVVVVLDDLLQLVTRPVGVDRGTSCRASGVSRSVLELDIRRTARRP